MFQMYRRVSVVLLTCVLLAFASTTILFAQSDDKVHDGRHHPVKSKRVNVLAKLSNNSRQLTTAAENGPDLEGANLFDVVRTPTPEPEPTAAPVVSNEQTAPPAQATPPAANASAETPATGQIESNMIAYWHLREDSIKRNNNGTWQVEIEVRVPTSYRYTFDMDYMISVQRDSANLGGDDYFTLRLSGMSCTQPSTVSLYAGHGGLRMETRNEFSYSDGPILLSFYC